MRGASLAAAVLASALIAYLLGIEAFFETPHEQNASGWVASRRLHVMQRPMLERLERAGWHICVLCQTIRTRPAASREVASEPSMQALRRAVAEDIQSSRQLFASVQSSYGHAPRFFDDGWLRHRHTFLGLTNVVLRPDRRVGDRDCGELRLLYRLGYVVHDREGGSGAKSDLPFTIAVRYRLDRETKSCRARYREVKRQISQADPAILASLSAQQNLLAVEYNFQVNRYPHDGTTYFSDQAHYVMGVLVPDESGTLRRAHLENTPDVPRLLRDSTLSKSLWEWLTRPSTRADIRKGILKIPQEYLARTGVTVTPYGMNRISNRPFTRLFSGPSFSLPTRKGGESGLTSTKKGFLRRLDESSCIGCHAARSVAGFHALGQITHRENSFNTMVEPTSAYFTAIQPWRQKFVEQDILPGEVPGPKPSPSFLEAPTGDACGLGDLAFADWVCPTGQACRDDIPADSIRDVGQCVDSEVHPRFPIGYACDSARLESQDNPLNDRFATEKTVRCEGLYFCTKSIYGFPGGFCNTGCINENPQLRCSNIPALGPFTICLEAGNSFEHCLQQHHVPVPMPRCRSNADCRQDYVCAAVEQNQGICAPPYFMHQLTIENHPL